MTFKVADTAIEYLKKTLMPGQYLRVALRGGGCSGLSFEFETVTNITDKELVINELVLLDKKSSLYLHNATLVYRHSIYSSLLTIESEKFKNVCGCGVSVGI